MKSAIPDKLANMISCKCKTGCGSRCGCRKSGTECSVLCAHCHGMECLNSPKAKEDDET